MNICSTTIPYYVSKLLTEISDDYVICATLTFVERCELAGDLADGSC